jgi:protein PsiE
MNKQILKGFQFILNGSLLLLGIMLTILMMREMWFILFDSITRTVNIHEVLQEILSFFLYFAFLSMVVKYFRENYHFPIRYLLYIGITGTIRFIIVNQQSPINNLILSIVILVLMIAYSLKSTFSEH